ncbi:hypothetical protein [Pseudidiomarina terrestris]|uniref:hypothetical protein n=1 Tax=Pseudidiomarina terrestris TaxID=2820060 RepID=UPI00264F7981|nr:hypothetical protein [Pseudidiomarina sp. 1ASP75-5]MDN7136134.1 hypothetical protein [Pseudidiomarina sp. 1ASP75-5]
MRTLAVVSAIAVALLGSAGAQADQQQREELRKQLEIMNSIFTTALDQERSEDGQGNLRSNRLSFNYLAGQGVVYRTKLGGGHRVFFNGGVPMPPMPDLPHLDGIESIELEAAMAEGLAAAGEVMREIEVVTDEIVINDGEVYFTSDDGDGKVKVVRQVSRKMRDHAQQVRELRRQVRDLELARANADDGKAIEKQLTEVREQLRKSEEKVASARAELDEAKTQLQARAAEHRAKRAEQRAQQLAQFEQTMTSTLCNYGRTLRALPDQEHVTFVVEGAGNGADGSDKIFIFNKQQLENCSSASDLLAKATTYSF